MKFREGHEDPKQSVSNSSEDDDEQIHSRTSTGPELASYHVSEMAPLTTAPAWDKINTRLNIRLTGPASLQGLCDEAYFTHTNLPATSALLLSESIQTYTVLFCLREMTRASIPKDVKDAFAELLPHSLSHCAQRSPRIITAIAHFLALCSIGDFKVPTTATRAILDYLHPAIPPETQR